MTSWRGEINPRLLAYLERQVVLEAKMRQAQAIEGEYTELPALPEPGDDKCLVFADKQGICTSKTGRLPN